MNKEKEHADVDSQEALSLRLSVMKHAMADIYIGCGINEIVSVELGLTEGRLHRVNDA